MEYIRRSYFYTGLAKKSMGGQLRLEPGSDISNDMGPGDLNGAGENVG